MTGRRTYSKRLPGQAPKGVGPKAVGRDGGCQDHPDDHLPAGNQVRDADELIGMGAVSMLGDDIQFMLDSVHPKRATPGGSVHRGLSAIRLSIVKCAEYGRQFRAHNGLSLVFEWWAEADEEAVQGELLWLFCHLGYKLRRVDHFASIAWIFRTALRVLDGGLGVAHLASTDAFNKHAEVAGKEVGLFMIGKACLCDARDTRHDLALGMGAVLSRLDAKDEQSLALLDVAVSLNVPGAREHAVGVLGGPPFGVPELKVLVSVSGSDNGWSFVGEPMTRYLVSNAALNGSEWRICAYSILINCLDRCDKTTKHHRWIVDQIETILELDGQELDDQAKLYSSLLLAFCLQSVPPGSLTLAAGQVEGMQAAMVGFSLLPDIHGANSVRRLADWLAGSGWVSPSPPP